MVDYSTSLLWLALWPGTVYRIQNQREKRVKGAEMIALPVKTGKKNSRLSPLFGKAKYFVLIKGDSMELIENESKSGKDVAGFLKQRGVEKLVVSHMGQKPFEMLDAAGIDVYLCNDLKLAANEVALQLLQDRLQKIERSNYKQLLENHGSHKESKSKQRCCQQGHFVFA